jgi:hypothetical protein
MNTNNPCGGHGYSLLYTEFMGLPKIEAQKKGPVFTGPFFMQANQLIRLALLEERQSAS